jgi:competence protein ComEC
MIRRHLTPALAVFLPLLAVAAGFGAGPWLLACAAGAGCAAAAAAVVLAQSGRRRAAVLSAAAGAGLLLGAATLVRMGDLRSSSYLPVSGSSVSTFTVRVVQDSTVSRTGSTLVPAALERAASASTGVSGSARGRVLLVVDGETRFAIGERLAVSAPLAAARGSGPEALVAFAPRGRIVTLGTTSAVWAARAAAREWLHRTFERAGYPVSALMEALLIGSREEVPASLSTDFRLTGSLHILALSGLHVTVLYGILGLLLGFLRGRWARFVPASVLLVAYQVLAGFMPSLLRATVMILAAGTAWCLDRDRDGLNALAVSGIVLLLIGPFQVQSVSFQLSFLAMAGIFLVGPLVRRLLEGRLPGWLLAPVALSAGAQAATLPLVLLAFGAWYPSGLVAGLLLVPLTTVLLWAGIAWIPLSLVPSPQLHQACVSLLGALYAAIEAVARFFARLPGVVPAPASVPWIAAVLFGAFAAAAVALPARRGLAQTALRAAP